MTANNRLHEHTEETLAPGYYCVVCFNDGLAKGRADLLAELAASAGKDWPEHIIEHESDWKTYDPTCTRCWLTKEHLAQEAKRRALQWERDA